MIKAMTRSFLTILLVLTSILDSFSQWRSCDLNVSVTSPQENQAVQSPATITFTLNVINQGPDTIYPTDTISYRAIHDFNFKKPIVNRVINLTVQPGDSFQLTDTISINAGITDSVLLSFQPPVLAFGPDNGKGLLSAEFENTRLDNSPRFRFYNMGNVNIVNLSDTQIRVFPNPVKNKFMVKTSSQNFQIELLNSRAQSQPITTVYNKYNHEYIVSLNSNPTPGVYTVVLKSDMEIRSTQLIITP